MTRNSGAEERTKMCRREEKVTSGNQEGEI
jgi:hypothetical protein